MNIDDVYVMCEEPLSNYAPKDIEKLYKDNPSLEVLADCYANSHNEYWWLEDELYDYQEGTNEYKLFKECVDSWWNLTNYFANEIIAYLGLNDDQISTKGIIYSILPFMDEHHWLFANGWWIQKELEDEI